MDPKKVQEKDGKARNVMIVNVEKISYLNKNYELVICEGENIGDTGLLIIFRIRAKHESLPDFLGRWDEKDNRLDIDICKVDKDEKKRFERGIGEYSGHHPEVICETDRKFNINIIARNINIFEGILSFGLYRQLDIHDSLSLIDTIGNKVRNWAKTLMDKRLLPFLMHKYKVSRLS
jgi:hypothetical protein